MTRAHSVLGALAGLTLAGCSSSSGGSGLRCAPGTHIAFGQCIPDLASSCGPGTHAEGDACFPDAAGVGCGAGTHLDGVACARDTARRLRRRDSPRRAGLPGLDVHGDGRGCNLVSGRFQVVELAWSGSVLTRLPATFEQLCEQQPTNVLRGCVHFQR